MQNSSLVNAKLMILNANLEGAIGRSGHAPRGCTRLLLRGP